MWLTVAIRKKKSNFLYCGERIYLKLAATWTHWDFKLRSFHLLFCRFFSDYILILTQLLLRCNSFNHFLCLFFAYKCIYICIYTCKIYTYIQSNLYVSSQLCSKWERSVIHKVHPQVQQHLAYWSPSKALCAFDSRTCCLPLTVLETCTLRRLTQTQTECGRERVFISARPLR